jgi:methylated-DNA-[protein]-cysteine S-methyltransferase
MHTYVIPESPVGTLALAADDDDRLCRLEFGEWSPRARAAEIVRVGEADGVIAETLRELDEYFAGTRHEFAVPLAPRGTPFQLAVWDALRAIPYGETTSYGEIARSVGRPNAVRAVGQANGRNPIAIIVPCHRVIGSDNSLTGYGGGMDRKRYLLGLEGASALTPALDL